MSKILPILHHVRFMRLSFFYNSAKIENMIVDGQSIDYLDWHDARMDHILETGRPNLRSHMEGVKEGDPVTGYRLFYRAASSGKLYPVEGSLSVKPYEKGEARSFNEDAPNVYTPRAGKVDRGGFYFWPTREQAEHYLDDAQLHAHGYMYGTTFDDYQKNIPGTLEIHRVEGIYKENKVGDIGDVMDEMMIGETVLSLAHTEFLKSLKNF